MLQALRELNKIASVGAKLFCYMGSVARGCNFNMVNQTRQMWNMLYASIVELHEKLEELNEVTDEH